ncbi:MAG: Unknown protein [uncultured Campylobacterales bacterium]|uniref:DNA-binding response regulator n=1 Tax=uncultured Campylobacterales bacterium TaxID=352960 RepID=A0A6S6ST14_9BACT|nr:MAG: Unknown protein [uncultured Campylobacterales bacterium]
MRILSVGLDKELLESLSKNGRYIFDESYNMYDSSNFLIFRSYDLILLSYKSDFEKTSKFIKNMELKYKTPTIVISSETSKSTEIDFLEEGANDFVKKPFDVDIILSRIDSKLRNHVNNKIYCGEKLVIELDQESVYFGDKKLDIRGKPFDILVYLIKYKNKVISKDRLLNAIWEEPEYITPNVIETSINAIRQKLDKAIDKKCIETVRRRGYKFCYGV